MVVVEGHDLTALRSGEARAWAEEQGNGGSAMNVVHQQKMTRSQKRPSPPCGIVFCNQNYLVISILQV